MSHFVHLHCHTEYSLMESTIRIKDLCSKLNQLGMGACALTDYGNMFGAAYFYHACMEQGMKPILICEIIVINEYFDKKADTWPLHHLIFPAQNNLRYHNLIKLVRGLWRCLVDRSQCVSKAW